jgi:hypothetical protein
VAKLKPETSREHSRLLKACVEAHEKYESLLPKPLTVPAGGRAKIVAFSEKDLQFIQDADWQRLSARDALDRFRATHGLI